MVLCRRYVLGPPGEGGGRCYEATLCPIGSGIADVGDWTLEPLPSLQSNDYTAIVYGCSDVFGALIG